MRRFRHRRPLHDSRAAEVRAGPGQVEVDVAELVEVATDGMAAWREVAEWHAAEAARQAAEATRLRLELRLHQYPDLLCHIATELAVDEFALQEVCLRIGAQ